VAAERSTAHSRSIILRRRHANLQHARSCRYRVPRHGPLLARSRRRPGPSSPPRSPLRCWQGFGCRRFRFFAGSPAPPSTPKADLFRQTGSALRIAGCGHWMLTGNRGRRDNHDERIAGLRRRGPLNSRFGCRVAEADERLMNSRDQDRQLVGPDFGYGGHMKQRYWS
jgi:hypothetical protein